MLLEFRIFHPARGASGQPRGGDASGRGRARGGEGPVVGGGGARDAGSHGVLEPLLSLLDAPAPSQPAAIMRLQRARECTADAAD